MLKGNELELEIMYNGVYELLVSVEFFDEV